MFTASSVQFEKIVRAGKIIWLTGLSGAGKSTIANEVHRLLQANDTHAVLLDGDILRQGLSSDLGFSENERSEHLRRVTEVAKLFCSEGFVVIVALISPYRKDRDHARRQFAPDCFYEIYCDCDLKCCEERDVKGLYRLARSGDVKNFTGISAPYEPPRKPDLRLDTGKEHLADCVDKILSLLQRSDDQMAL